MVLVDVKGRRSSQSAAAGYDRVLAALPDLGYCPVAAEDGVALYERRGNCAER